MTQLRIYTINQGALQQFAKEWNNQIRPLREKLGFKVLGAWTVASTNQFVWIMGYDGSGSWEELDKAYFNSDERLAMDPNPARNIARMEEYSMDTVLWVQP
jgi:hypothetical protein